jgi:hypothetical protein
MKAWEVNLIKFSIWSQEQLGHEVNFVLGEDVKHRCTVMFVDEPQPSTASATWKVYLRCDHGGKAYRALPFKVLDEVQVPDPVQPVHDLGVGRPSLVEVTGPCELVIKVPADGKIKLVYVQVA